MKSVIIIWKFSGLRECAASCRTLAIALNLFNEARNASGLGASDLEHAKVKIPGTRAWLKVSYNGRVWRADGTEFPSETDPD